MKTQDAQKAAKRRRQLAALNDRWVKAALEEEAEFKASGMTREIYSLHQMLQRRKN